MPPNLGGFFMVRSYYPSECHADYFDFERIERSEERFSRNAETDLVCRLLLEKKKRGRAKADEDQDRHQPPQPALAMERADPASAAMRPARWAGSTWP